MKKRTALLLAAAILSACLLCGCGRGEEPAAGETPAAMRTESPPPASTPAPAPTRPAEDIVRELVYLYGCYGDEADETVAGLLAELRAADSRQGELWERIMAYWAYANTELSVHTGSLPDDLPRDDSLCLAVLGFELNDDGTMKEELIGRLTTALQCARQYPKAVVLCTGGGTARDNPAVTEAGLMGEWLLAHGLEKERLLLEDRSRTTAENALFSYVILLDACPQVSSVAIVSSSYHIAWGSLLFESAFLKAASERQTPEIHVVSNCAYPIVSAVYRESEMLRWETGGMLQLIGENNLALKFYYDNVEKPAL